MSESHTLRVMSFNVRHATDSTPHSWEERLPLIEQLLQREQPDLIGTQECFYRQVTDMLHILPGYDWLGLGRSGGSRGEYAAIFYKKDRFVIQEYDHYWLSDTPSVIGSTTWGNKAPRMVTWGRFLDKQSGQSFILCNTHMDHQSPEAREQGAHLMMRQAEAFDPLLPVIITGDFNIGPDSEPYRIMTSEGRFSDTWHTAELREGEGLGTFNNYKSPDGRGASWRIDWILTRGAVKAQCSRILDDQDRDNGRYPSDHYPIITELSVG